LFINKKAIFVFLTYVIQLQGY